MSGIRYDEVDVLIVDGANTLWRSCYANAGLGYKTDSGFQPTGGVYGFFESILSILHKIPTDAQVWIAWEGTRSRSSRREILPTYKKREPDEKRERLAKLVGVQASILRGCLDHTRFVQASADSWEGDDAIATIAEASSRSGDNVMIYSGDGDLLQVLTDKPGRGFIVQHKPTTKKGADPQWTAERIREEFGFEPELVADAKAIGGDPSDCYKGAPGIGEVWARRIISEHGDLHAVKVAAEAGAVAGSAKKADTILEHWDEVSRCLQIAKVQRRVPIRFNEGEPSEAELKRIFARLRFHSINTKGKLRLLA